jgi:hypothetical protein
MIRPTTLHPYVRSHNVAKAPPSTAISILRNELLERTMMLLKSPLLLPLLLAILGSSRRTVHAQDVSLLTTGLPRQTTYAELVLLMNELYNPGNCGGSYQRDNQLDTFDNLVSINTRIICNGQNFTIYGSGNGLDVKFPVVDNNYTAIDLDTLQACGRTMGCFNLTYTGSYPALPTYVGCDAFAQRSSGGAVANCTSCVACTTGETHIKVTIDCANVNSEFSTSSDCVAPFTTNSTVMGVTAAQGGGGGGTSGAIAFSRESRGAACAAAVFAASLVSLIL